jgi:hypothetical protein
MEDALIEGAQSLAGVRVAGCGGKGRTLGFGKSMQFLAQSAFASGREIIPRAGRQGGGPWSNGQLGRVIGFASEGFAHGRRGVWLRATEFEARHWFTTASGG